MPKTVSPLVAAILGLQVLPVYGVELALNGCRSESNRQHKNCLERCCPARRNA